MCGRSSASLIRASAYHSAFPSSPASNCSDELFDSLLCSFVIVFAPMALITTTLLWCLLSSQRRRIDDHGRCRISPLARFVMAWV